MFNILIVEDDRHTRTLYKAIIKNAGYNVFTAENGKEALNELDKRHIDLILLDVMLPEMDGNEFTEEVRKSENNVPILMVTAKQLQKDKHKGFLVGTDDYLIKPVDEEEMLLRIKALLRRAKIVNERKILIGDIVIDYDSFTVTKDNKVESLPQKEFLLLYKLLSYPGKIFTRIELMDEIWGNECETGWETITVHIGRLRRKFENYKEFEIEAVRGLGYRAVKKV